MMTSSGITHKGLVISGSDLIKAYIVNKSAAFLIAFFLTILFNFSASLSNERTKHEFLPSVKDVIAGFYPNRSIFQILIALCSFFQVVFSVVIFSLFTTESRPFARITALISLIRLFGLLCFSYITAVDDISAFNNSYVLYLVTGMVWIYFVESSLRSKSSELNHTRLQIKYVYSMSLVAASVFFYKHQIEQVNYAYSISSFFQWIMVGSDIFFDSLFIQEVRSVELRVDFPEGSLKRHIV